MNNLLNPAAVHLMKIFVSLALTNNYLISPDVTAAIVLERIIGKKVLWEFDFIILQNLSYIFLLFWHQHGRLVT